MTRRGAENNRIEQDRLSVVVTDARSKLPELIDNQVRDGGCLYLTRYGHRHDPLLDPLLGSHENHAAVISAHDAPLLTSTLLYTTAVDTAARILRW